MASYKDVLRMLRKGESPERIVRLMEMRPSHWKRMLNGKRFRDALRTEEDLAAVIASHAVSLGMHSAAERFGELLGSDKPETARKVALAILHQGLRRYKGKRAGKLRPHAKADQLPWLGGDREPPGEGRGEDGRAEGQADHADDRRSADHPQPDANHSRAG